MSKPGSRPRTFEVLRRLPVLGRAMDWGLGEAAASKTTREAGARIAGLKVTESVCPFCAVGCGQVVYTRGGELIDIEGNPRSPINQGTLCPKGACARPSGRRCPCHRPASGGHGGEAVRRVSLAWSRSCDPDDVFGPPRTA
jgi:hypothetical protein